MTLKIVALVALYVAGLLHGAAIQQVIYQRGKRRDLEERWPPSGDL